MHPPLTQFSSRLLNKSFFEADRRIECYERFVSCDCRRKGLAPFCLFSFNNHVWYSGLINVRKEVIMRVKAFYGWVFLPLLLLFLLLAPNVEAAKKVELVGRETLNFTLPSTHDRLINYGDEYYGKYHLIITFFPAAFTPV
jgi:hypothetical protein